jgi:hypothetical protein
MTDEILKLARECGASVEQWMTTIPRPFAVHFELEALAKFVAAIRSDERAESSKLADALMALLGDTQHAKHPSCTDGGYCPVRDAREALEAFNSRIGGAAE